VGIITGNSPICPVCETNKSDALYPRYQGRCISSQMHYYDEIVLDNRCCTNCGLIFNAQGFRNREEHFFELERKPQVISFGENNKTTQERGMDIFESLLDIPDSGEILDFGAGRGTFLSVFKERYPRWRLSAIEPQRDYYELVNNIEITHGFNQSYDKVKTDKEFDMLVVMNVLEHLPNPLHAMKWIADHVKVGGMVLMRHPDFEKLPGDLFCPDHLNKMTLPHTRQMAEHVGLEVLGVDTSTSIFYLVMCKREKRLRGLPNCYELTVLIARRAEHVARQTIAAVGEAASAARARGSKAKAAVFGTSPIGSMAHLLLDCKDDIACFVDENQNTWGREIDGLAVVGPDRMAEYGVTDLALAISPLYWKAVAAKMAAFEATVHVPRI